MVDAEPARACPSAGQPKLKILALHGYRQNAEAFRQKTGSFRKMLHKWAQFTYITAPHKVKLSDDDKSEDVNIGQGKEEEQYGWFFNKEDLSFRGTRKGGLAIGFEESVKLVESVFEKEGPFDGILGLKLSDDDKSEDVNIGQGKEEEQYGWFFNKEDLSFRGTRKGGLAIGFEESVKLVESVFEKEGPFDGILGFSQGACFVGLLCSLQQRGLTKCRFSFAIMSSGFKSGSLPHLKYYNDPILLPSLHIFGTGDEIIPCDMSESLSEAFQNPVIVTHPGGHYLPATAPQKSPYQEFIKLRFLQKYISEQNLVHGDDD